jgi:hypothetical protein
MKIFVGYGFNDRDKWVADLVFPIIKAFNDEVITGEDLQGEKITNAVREKIKQSEALIGFLTRRGDPDDSGRWRTHRWVIEEIDQGIEHCRHVLEVREEGVDEQGGIAGDRQHILYRESERDKCLVEIVKTLGKWHREGKIMLRLLPDDCKQELGPLLTMQDLKSFYTLLVEDEIGPEVPCPIIPKAPGGLFIVAKDVPRGASIRVHIEYQGRHWRSHFESTDMLAVHLVTE